MDSILSQFNSVHTLAPIYLTTIFILISCYPPTYAFLPLGIFDKYITWMSCSMWARYTCGLFYLPWFHFDEYTVSPKTVSANQQIKIFPVSGILIMGHHRNKGEMGKLMGRWEERACNSSCWQCNHISQDLHLLLPTSPLTYTINKYRHRNKEKLH